MSFCQSSIVDNFKFPLLCKTKAKKIFQIDLYHKKVKNTCGPSEHKHSLVLSAGSQLKLKPFNYFYEPWGI